MVHHDAQERGSYIRGWLTPSTIKRYRYDDVVHLPICTHKPSVAVPCNQRSISYLWAADDDLARLRVNRVPDAPSHRHVWLNVDIGVKHQRESAVDDLVVS